MREMRETSHTRHTSVEDENRRYLFEEAPVLQALTSLIVPTVLSQLITVLYNMADTFFIGRTNDPDQVAAASICLPLFVALTGIANLFGIGGSSVIARSLGRGDRARAREASVFAILTGGAVAVLYGLVLLLFREKILLLAGANPAALPYARQYLFWCINVGALPTVMSGLLSHLVRSEGCAREAGIGTALGGLLNIALDPLFIFPLHLGVSGAAMATMLSNVVSCLYFAILLRRRRGEDGIGPAQWDQTILSADPRLFPKDPALWREILLVGLPSALMNLCGVFSNIVMNRLMVSYSNAAVAGIGIAKRIDMLSFALAMGMSQGTLPLVAYNFSSGNRPRLREILRTAFAMGLVVSFCGMLFLFFGASQVVRFFIDDPKTVLYGGTFQRIICLSCPCVCIAMMIITIFQSTGHKKRPLFLSILRKGGLDVPFMILLQGRIGMNGIAIATPCADTLAMVLAICLFVPFLREIHSAEARTTRKS